MRESLSRLADPLVHGVIIQGNPEQNGWSDVPRFEMSLAPDTVYALNQPAQHVPLKDFAGQSVFAIAGIGGVFTPEQAYAKIRSGSSLVMFISSLMYRGPQQITVLKRGLAQLLRRDGFEHVSDAVGVDVE